MSSSLLPFTVFLLVSLATRVCASGAKGEDELFNESKHVPFNNTWRSDYMKSVGDATTFPPSDDTYDFIIVGGGTAGCPLAATLSQFFKVLVLERGGSNEEHPETMTTDGFMQILADTQRGFPNGPAERFVSDEGVPNARGHVLGGSSSCNAGFYSRGDLNFFKSEAAAGVQWDIPLIRESYEWVEKVVMHEPQLNEFQMAAKVSMILSGILPYNEFTTEHIRGTKMGGTTFDPQGRRHSAADLLGYGNLDNLAVALHAQVVKILIQRVGAGEPITKGVVYRDSLGRQHHAMLRPRGEVILSAGALGSPQLLLLSGVGPTNLLEPHHIPVTVPNPFVGQFVADNPHNSISFLSPIPLNTTLIQVVGITDAFDIEPFTNVLPVIPGRFNLSIATIMQKIPGPASHGSLWLTSPDVRVSPAVRFNYFSNPADMVHCVMGMRKIAQVLQSPRLDEFKFPQLLGGKGYHFIGPAMPCDDSDIAKMEEICRSTLSTIYHYHGGCIMGKVVDPDYRVIGVDSLRVVDGSTFTVSPGTNPQATVMMLGRYVGVKMIAEKLSARGH